MRIHREAETPEAGKKNIKVLSADLPEAVRGVAAWDAEDRKYIVLTIPDDLCIGIPPQQQVSHHGLPE